MGEDASPVADQDGSPQRLTFMQRQALKGLAKQAHKRPDEPLSPADWEAYWKLGSQRGSRAVKRVLRAMPSSPRCGFCGTPFSGAGARVAGRLGYRPSRKNPNLSAVCVEAAPPGGTTLEIGVLFADLRGFTSESELQTPQEVSAKLRRFYACAEKVFFPEALIDKLIGDEVMALYVPSIIMRTSGVIDDPARQRVAEVMLEHTRQLLERGGYGSSREPGVRDRHRARLRGGVHRQHRRHRGPRLHGGGGRGEHGRAAPVPGGWGRGAALRSARSAAARTRRGARGGHAQGKAGARRRTPRAMVRTVDLSEGEQMASHRNRFGPHNPDETYVTHAFPEHLADLGEVQMNYASVGDASKPALLLVPGQTESWWGYESGAATARRALPRLRRRPPRPGPLVANTRSLHARQHGQRPRPLHRRRRSGDRHRERPFVGRRAVGVAVRLREAGPGASPRTTRTRRCSPREVNPATGQGIRQAIGPMFRLWSTFLGDQWSIGDWDGMRSGGARRAALVARRAVHAPRTNRRRT